MDEKSHDLKRFLEAQLQWTKERIQTLDELDSKLYEMKEIAEYAMHHELTSSEISELNEKLAILKNEISFLERRLDSVFH